jgi:phycocyanobilin:ferredoxin oxidoreductase
MTESKIWPILINIQQFFEKKFDQTGTLVNEPGMEKFNQPGWINKVWASNSYRRAHIDVVDARNTKGLWMMHCCVFPHTHNPAPIFGFDVVAGKNKITGCFIDYSPTDNRPHAMSNYFAEEVSRYEWNKPRALPEWAQRIFSENMVAAGNVSDETELSQISSLACTLVSHYVDTISRTNNTVYNTSERQNYYAQNQKQNPHTPKVMTSLGLNESDVQQFIQECLFPEIK